MAETVAAGETAAITAAIVLIALRSREEAKVEVITPAKSNIRLKGSKFSDNEQSNMYCRSVDFAFKVFPKKSF